MDMSKFFNTASISQTKVHHEYEYIALDAWKPRNYVWILEVTSKHELVEAACYQ